MSTPTPSASTVSPPSRVDYNKEIRFIVDVLSGTSAGGINAIYLGKALANNQTIGRLKQLWVGEGDIALLLNDKESLAGLSLLPQDPSQSLLNGRRMYLKLLKALDDMEADSPSQSEFRSPLVDELDLFITATDIEGVPVPLRLSDRVVYERRHRNVFRFKYSGNETTGKFNNDFLADSNPFLAFAARCTSSFPFAFEPMRLCDIDEVLETFPTYRSNTDCKSGSPKWQRFFSELLDPKTGNPNLRFQSRSFGDGGYLDNKPFSYAIEALVERQSNTVVDRKLIYIEPSPEHPEDLRQPDDKPNALANVKAALLDLPSYETMREDLQRILERNKLIERVQRIISGIEKDVSNHLPRELVTKLIAFRQARASEVVEPANQQDSPQEEQTEGELWSERDLSDMVEENGRYFLSYRRLRISDVTDEIAKLIANVLNFDASSDLLVPLRCLVRAWREDKYSDYKKEKTPTVNQFLWEYDYSYRLRRLSFVRERIDKLHDFGTSLKADLEDFRDKFSEVEKLEKTLGLGEAELKSFRNRYPRIGWLLGLLKSGSWLSRLDPTRTDELRQVLLFFKSELAEVERDLHKQARLRAGHSESGEQGMGAPSTDPVFVSLKRIGLKSEHLNSILGLTDETKPAGSGETTSQGGSLDEEDCFRRARAFYVKHSGDNDIGDLLRKALDTLKIAAGTTFQQSRSRCKLLFDPNTPFVAESDCGKAFLSQNKKHLELIQSDIFKETREYLGYYYHNFDDYDQISFPIFYQADVGEADLVEVIRISPEDAVNLIDEAKERRDSPNGKGRQKLAGTGLHHFGAFMDRIWRQNDIMWGRLDGAERLITALLPAPEDADVRKSLIDEAQAVILSEELPPESRLELRGLMTEALLRASTGEPIEQAIYKVTSELTGFSPIRTRLNTVMRSSLEDPELLEFIKTGYEVNRKLDARTLLETISRSTHIIGKVFEDVAEKNNHDGRSLSWIARLGQLFWGLVEVAVPGSIWNKLWTHWLYVLYAFEFFTIVAGILLSRPGAQQFGWTAFGITALINVIVLLLKDLMRGHGHVFRATAVLALLSVALLSALGLLEFLGAVLNVRVGAAPGSGSGLPGHTATKNTSRRFAAGLYEVENGRLAGQRSISERSAPENHATGRPSG